MLGQNVEKSNKNHKIIQFSLLLCLLSPSLSDTVPVLTPAPLALILKGNILHHHVHANYVCGRRSWDTPCSFSLYFYQTHTKPPDHYVYL